MGTEWCWVVGDEDGVVMLWDLSTSKRISPLFGHSGAVWSLAFSGDSALVASGKPLERHTRSFSMLSLLAVHFLVCSFCNISNALSAALPVCARVQARLTTLCGCGM